MHVSLALSPSEEEVSGLESQLVFTSSHSSRFPTASAVQVSTELVSGGGGERSSAPLRNKAERGFWTVAHLETHLQLCRQGLQISGHQFFI
jgi:hypothetical protein